LAVTAGGRVPIITQPYLEQRKVWPERGRQLLAQFDDDGVVVYQAYRKELGRFAVDHGYFGGSYNFNRMSWIKTNFLWMMFRSGWALKLGQEMVLAVWLKRPSFDDLLSRCEPAGSEVGGQRPQGARHEIIFQWDPDHDPAGKPVERRALQIGLRGEALRSYAREWILRIEDLTPFVAEQRAGLERGGLTKLATPREAAYPVKTPSVARKLGLAE